MKKVSILSILLTSVFANNFAQDKLAEENPKAQEAISQEDDFFGNNFFKAIDQMHKAFEQDMQNLQKRFESMHKVTVSQTDLKREADKTGQNWLVITLDLPNKNLTQNNVKIFVKNNNLEGVVEDKESKLEFYIHEGQILSTSVETRHEKPAKKDEKDKEKSNEFMTNYSEQVQTIPMVANLEKMQYEVKDGKLILRLPTVDTKSSKPGWQQISNNQVQESAK